MRLELWPAGQVRAGDGPQESAGQLPPLLPEIVQSRLLKILGRHSREELDRRIEVQEPRLREPRYFGGAVHVYDEEATALAVLRAEVRGLRFRLFEDPRHLLAYRPVKACLVELLGWNRHVENEPHGKFRRRTKTQASLPGE